MLKEDDRKNAYDAIDFARGVRSSLRRKGPKGDPNRDRALKAALQKVKSAMKPVRTEIHRTQYHAPSTYRMMILGISKDLQTERRKLWKMLQPTKPADRDHLKTLIERVLESQTE